MGGVDYSSFYKFVASLGLLILVAGLVFPITVVGIAAPEASCQSEACSAKESLQLLLYKYWWIASGAALLTGVILMLYGMSKWSARQQRLDLKEDAEIAKAITVEEMSESDVDAKTRREMTQMEADNLTQGATQEAKASESEGQETVDDRRVPAQGSHAARHLMYAEVESVAIRSFVDVMSRRGRVVQPNTRIVVEGKTLTEVDALALSAGGKLQTYALEIRYTQNLSKNWKAALESVIVLSVHLRKIGNAVPILAFAYDDATEATIAQLREAHRAIIDFPSATIMCRRDFLAENLTKSLKSLPDNVDSPLFLEAQSFL